MLEVPVHTHAHAHHTLQHQRTHSTHSRCCSWVIWLQRNVVGGTWLEHTYSCEMLFHNEFLFICLFCPIIFFAPVVFPLFHGRCIYFQNVECSDLLLLRYYQVFEVVGSIPIFLFGGRSSVEEHEKIRPAGVAITPLIFFCFSPFSLLLPLLFSPFFPLLSFSPLSPSFPFALLSLSLLSLLSSQASLPFSPLLPLSFFLMYFTNILQQTTYERFKL